MPNEQAEKRVKELRLLLEKSRYLYYILDAPELSDEVYDSLMRELETLESKYKELDHPMSPTHRVGGGVLDHFDKVKHEIRQWSFDNVFNQEELRSWEVRNMNLLHKEGLTITPSYVAELKIDGLKVVLTYRDGILIRGATRGDGEIGEDITAHIKTFKSVPLILPEPVSITVIGEAWMRKKDLERINKQRESEGLPLYANTRNLAAGTLRQLDTAIVASRHLVLFAYDIEGGEYKTQEEELKTLSRFGFLVNRHYIVCKTLDEVETFFHSWTHKRSEQDYGIDGLVIKINEREAWDTLGYTAKIPRGGIAYKFPAEEVATELLSITVQVGRTGAVTPVAELLPVLLAGSTVKRATLHNEEEIQRLGIHIGDTVLLRKAGDVIPEIFGIIKDLRPKNARTFVMPTACPECGTRLAKEIVGKESSAAWYCKNTECPAKHLEGLIHFVSKKGMNIDGLGEKIVAQFREIGLVSDYASIYHLKKEDIEGLEGFGEKSAVNIIDAIKKSRTVPFHQFLFSLGIRHVGETTAKDIARFFKTFSALRTSHFEELSSVPGVGEKVAESVISYFKDEGNRKMLERLLKEVTIEEAEEVGGTKLRGLTFVITGSLPTLTRDEAKNLIEDNGGKVAGSVSKKTNYLLAGDGGGSKREDAVKFGIKIIDEEVFKNML